MTEKINSALFLLVIADVFTQAAADCRKDIFEMDNRLFVLSDSISDANTARESCSLSGGKLLEVQNEQRKNDLLKTMKQKYTSNLSTVDIFVHRTIPGVTGYRLLSGDPRDPDYEQKWNRPNFGNLRQFMIQASRTNTFTPMAQFCRYAAQDYIFNRCTDGSGFVLTFNVYNGTTDASDMKLLFSKVLKVGAGWSSRLVLSPDALPSNLKEYSRPQYDLTLWIPDINVFIGARSDIKESSWFWNNGTEVTNTNYPTSNSSVCQQMAWPLTYDYGINLSPKACTPDKAFYACQFEFNVDLEAFNCNGTILRVHWNATNFRAILNSSPSFVVHIKESETSTEKEMSFSAQEAVISGLQKRTDYEIKATLKDNSSCASWNITTTASQTTGYGLPDPVVGAHVDNTTTESRDCAIAWKYNASFLQIFSYEITARNGNKTLTLVRDISNEDRIANTTQLMIIANNLTCFGFNKTVLFHIQAVTCEGRSKPSQVVGSCQTPIEVPPTPAPAFPIWIGVGIAGLLVVILLAVGCYFKRHKRKETVGKRPMDASQESRSNTNLAFSGRNETPSSSGNFLQSSVDLQDQTQPYANEIGSIYTNLQAAPSAPILAKDFEEAYLTEASRGFPTFQDQFKAIQTFSLENERTHNKASKKENSKSNRYKNIYPYDHALVSLKNQKYVNASVIQGNGIRKYIATQGPKKNTIEDLWKLIWEQNSSIIVMLCNVTENEKKKSEPYWPDQHTPLQCGNLKISLCFELKLKSIIERVISVTNSKTQEERSVVQFQFISWPDHSIPVTTTGLAVLRKLVNEQHRNQRDKAPIVVHCSAGAGRTGAYIAVDNAIEKLEATGTVDLVNIVLMMRENRKDMVQTAKQYVLVHKLVLENILLPDSQYSIDEFSKFMAKCGWEEKVSQEFQLFANNAVMLPIQLLNNANEENIYENQPTSQADIHQIKLPKGSSKNQRIMDAHIIKNTHFPGAFIISSKPNRKKGDDFWDMAIHCNSKLIVALDSTDDDILQQAEDHPVKMENKLITINDVEENNLYTKKDFSVTFLNNEMDPFHATHMLLNCWKENSPSVADLVEVIQQIEASMESNPESTAIVYSNSDCRKPGVMLAFASLVEDVNDGSNIDVFRRVKDLKDHRRGLIDSLDDYKLCYQLMNSYLIEYHKDVV